MNFKNFIIAGIVGGIVDFILGGVFYQGIFPDLYPDTGNTKMEFIILGCFTFALFMSYVFAKWANITTIKTGLIAGATFGFFYGLSMNFFMYSGMEVIYKNMVIDTLVNIAMGAGTGAAIAFVNGKLK